MGTHFNCRLDDGTWRALFGRWHAGEDARALRREAGVSADTWSANARRLGMRLRDLPPDHPRRRAPPHAARADDWKHPRSRLTEGEWRALFVLRAQGVPDVALCARYGVAPSTICSQAKVRGLKRPRGLAGTGRTAAAVDPSTASRSPSPSRGDGEETGTPLAGVEIVMGDPARTLASFDGAIAEAGRRADFARVTEACRAKLSVKRALFGEGARGMEDGAPGPSHPVSASPRPPSPVGEGEAVAPLVLRAAQRAPEGDWSTWLFLGGRGAGKTLAGASWLADRAEALGAGGRLALVGPTLHDVREVMVEGPSGVLGLPRWDEARFAGRRPVYEAGRRRLVFPNGAVAQAFSAEDPDSLRGPQFAAAWADEFCAWREGEATLALLRMGLRLAGGAGEAPRLCVTTTPRPTAALRRLRAEPGLVQTHAATHDNAEHLAPGFVAGLERLYGGTRRAAQEIEGRVVEAEGGLFTAGMMMEARKRAEEVEGAPGRVVIGVDPTATAGGDACGIVVVGRVGEAAVVLADRTVAGVSPRRWARRVAAAAEEFGAVRVVAEVNQGGDMVRAVLRASGCAVPVREVRATRGKRLRAEPVAALYEQGRVAHAAGLGPLEEELMALGQEGAGSLDRADALVWAVTDLLIDGARGAGRPGVRALDLGVRPGWGLAGRGAGW
ncbi:DNA-packaging protein [Brevundimonas fluminis]|uniref:DNA-packaging protein n=1 Tax=Brevundimonas fluminis TaxID=2487274 RepID=UPI001F49AB79|nr:terminase family protein [Brevundimonas fluminis]